MVIEDVQKILNIKGCYVFKDSFFRDNLSYTIEKVDDLKKGELIEKISRVIRIRFAGQCGIIYCLTVREVDEVTQKLCSLGVRATSYHAQLAAQQRKDAYYNWFNNQSQVIVATVAFGLYFVCAL